MALRRWAIVKASTQLRLSSERDRLRLPPYSAPISTPTPAASTTTPISITAITPTPIIPNPTTPVIPTPTTPVIPITLISSRGEAKKLPTLYIGASRFHNRGDGNEAGEVSSSSIEIYLFKENISLF